jgi:hypothetical protein
MLPSFFLAGAPKAGTSTLDHHLRSHPDVFMSRVKEPHHFSWEDDGWPRWAVKDRTAYEALFAGARPDQPRGESSTWTLYSRGAPARIEAAVPDARFVVLLRDPTDRAYSNWAYNVASDFETIRTFEGALTAEPRRVAEGGPWHHHYVAAGRYAEQVERYLERFGRERVLVLLFEELQADPAAVASEAYGFLGVDPAFRPDVEVVRNRTTVPRFGWVRAFTSGSGSVKRALKWALPAPLAAGLGRRLKEANGKPPPPLAPEVRRRLDEAFRDDVERLAGLLGRDLSSVWLKSTVAA